MDDQVVVELGAGCGLAGIVALKYCRPRSLISTDFDPNVLNQLTENFRFNFDESDKRGRIEFCDWNDQESVRGLEANADLIIASGELGFLVGLGFSNTHFTFYFLLYLNFLDVVYDPDLLEPFVRTLETLTANNPKSRILIAGQERNPETLEKFLEIVGKYMFVVTLKEFSTYQSFQTIQRFTLTQKSSHLSTEMSLLFVALPSTVRIQLKNKWILGLRRLNT